jgi:antitoxin HicB
MSIRATRKSNPHVGSDFDDFLGEEGVYDQAQTVAVKRVLAHELERVMLKAHSTMTGAASLVIREGDKKDRETVLDQRLRVLPISTRWFGN